VKKHQVKMSKPGAASVIVSNIILPKFVPVMRANGETEDTINDFVTDVFNDLSRSTSYKDMAARLSDPDQNYGVNFKITAEALSKMVEPQLQTQAPPMPGFWERTNITDKKFGGSGNMNKSNNAMKKAGAEPNSVATQSTMYVPTSLTVDRRVPIERPCGYQERDVVGPMYWQTQCDRTDQSGVQDCKLVPVASKVRQIIPAKCTENQFSVLKGVDLQTQTVTDANGRAVSVQTVAKPVVERYKQVVAVRPAGEPIEYERLQRLGEPKETPFTPANFTRSGTGTVAHARDLGGGASNFDQKKHGGNAKEEKRAGANVGGAIDMPAKATKLRLNETDLDNQVLPVPEGMMERPSAWAALDPVGGVHFNMYDDSYGTTSARTRQFGFPFKRHHLNYDRLKFFGHETNYLQWLISVSYKLRAEYSEVYKYNYDAVIDTEATLESQILYGIGKLEARRKFFDRFDIFAGASGFDRKEMHPIIRKYIDTPRTEIWFSPLTHRYLAMDQDDTKYPDEAATLGNLKQLYTSIIDYLKQGYTTKTGDRVVLPVPFAKQDITMDTMAFAEDYLMALLERLQYTGYAFNTNSDNAKGTVEELLDPKQRKYLRDEAVKYLELFRLEDGSKTLVYLPGIRRMMASTHGVKLPEPEGFEVDSSWRSIKATDIPVVVDGVSIPQSVIAANEPSYYERISQKKSGRKASRR